MSINNLPFAEVQRAKILMEKRIADAVQAFYDETELKVECVQLWRADVTTSSDKMDRYKYRATTRVYL